MDAILESLHLHSPNAIIAVAGIPSLKGFPFLPQPLRMLFGLRGETFDSACRRVISRHPEAIHVHLEFEAKPEKFSPDGLHPSEESYQEFDEMMARHIVDRLKKILFNMGDAWNNSSRLYKLRRSIDHVKFTNRPAEIL